MTRSESLESLKTRIAGIERLRAVEAGAVAMAGTGHAGIDHALGGGLARGRVHEVFAAEADDAGCAAGFVVRAGAQVRAGIGRRVGVAARGAGRTTGRQAARARGLSSIGIDPRQVIIGLMPDPLAVLRAAADVVRCPEVGVAVIELWQSPRLLDLTASRRLALAAEGSGVTVIALRIAAQPCAQRGADPLAGGCCGLCAAGSQCAGPSGMDNRPVAPARAPGGRHVARGVEP